MAHRRYQDQAFHIRGPFVTKHDLELPEYITSQTPPPIESYMPASARVDTALDDSP